MSYHIFFSIQLDKLGIQYNRLPNELPFVMSLSYHDTNASINDEVERKPMSKTLLDAVSSDESFDTLYMVRTLGSVRRQQ